MATASLSKALQKALPGTPLNPTVVTDAELQGAADPPPAAGLTARHSVARFFIDRPVFAIVISLFLVLRGRCRWPAADRRVPEISLPTVQVNANYLGASSDVVEESVTVPLDQQINGVTDMMYINSVSGDDGNANITVTFELERDPDLAAVEVQNRVSQAQSQLPQEVITQGVTVRKQSPDTLMFSPSIRRTPRMTGCSSTTTRTSTSSTS